MSLKLLLLFVEYTEFNSLLLLQAISRVDTQNGQSVSVVYLMIGRFNMFFSLCFTVLMC